MRLSLPSLAHLRMRWRVALVGAYLLVLLPLLLLFNVGLTPDSLIFVLLGAAFIMGRPALFVRDWGVFLLFVLLWQQTEFLAKWAGFPLHKGELVAADRAITWPFLHGQLPQVWLQQHLYHPGHWQWYDILSWTVYALHFPEPLLVGFAIWLRSREGFRSFSTAFLTLAALAFVGYIVYPAIPPWMAGSWRRGDSMARQHFYHLIPHVYKIFSLFNDHVLRDQLGHSYQHVLDVKYNLTAAMPSLHAAFPVLSALYLRKTFGRWGLLMLLYAALMWFAVIYMAEHWVIDVIVGLVCAVLAYAMVEIGAWLWGERARGRHAAEPREPALLSAVSRKARSGR